MTGLDTIIAELDYSKDIAQAKWTIDLDEPIGKMKISEYISYKTNLLAGRIYYYMIKPVIRGAVAGAAIGGLATLITGDTSATARGMLAGALVDTAQHHLRLVHYTLKRTVDDLYSDDE